MNIEDLILEVPQRIEPIDFNLSDYTYNRKFAVRLLFRFNKKLIEKFGDLSLYEFPDQFALIDENIKEILYYLRYKKTSRQNVLGKRWCIQQIRVWRRHSAPETKDLAAKIFFDHLLLKTGCIITDIKQTENGETFWHNRIGEALQNPKYFVYFVSFLNPVEIIELKNRKDFDKIVNKSWGDSKKFVYKRIIIFDKKL
jgi:hypothetical protein